MLDPQGEQDRTDDARHIDHSAEATEINDRIQCAGKPASLAVSIKPNMLKDDQLRRLIHTCSLNDKQHTCFQHITHWCLDFVSSQKSDTPPTPFYIFITGGAGTGKSQLIRAIYHQATRILQQPGDDPSNPTVLLTSPTGTAAYNIGGMNSACCSSASKRKILLTQK